VRNKINEEGICLKHGKRDLNKANYKNIKHLIRRGINVGYQDMLKIRKFIEYSTVDSIDKGRAYVKYIKLMKEMEISNRIVKAEVNARFKAYNRGCRDTWKRRNSESP
jgi:hypothetical protein